jgi:RNA-directed DNA polymerase
MPEFSHGLLREGRLFHPSSHGFRPHRGAHTAIAQAKEHLTAGYQMVVDIDVSKFFDRVHHRRLRGRIALRVSDRRLPALVRRMLTAGVVGVPTKSPILWGAP